MEESLYNSLPLDNSTDTDDSMCLRLSTFFVAHIEELKERISQLESIFCKQLFPSFQLRLKSLDKRLLEERKAADDECQKRENSLLHQINELRLEHRCAQEQVHQLEMSLESSKNSLIRTEDSLRNSDYDKKQLLIKVENLERNEEIIAKLKKQLSEISDEMVKEKEQQEKLRHEIALKDQSLVEEKRKRKVLYAESIKRYKEAGKMYSNLKSQYTLLLNKVNGSKEDSPFSDRMEEEKGLPSPYPSNKRSLQDLEYENEEIKHLASNPTEIKTEEKSIQRKHGGIQIDTSLTSVIPPSKHLSVNGKSDPSVGPKKSDLSWRETRKRQEPGGLDPHDDFLDTPMENARKLKISPKEEAQDLPVLAPNDMDFNSSDDETQDIASQEVVPQKQNISILGTTANKGEFKYVGPVRKKAERENLKGVECNQCKKFYDAVLPDDNTTNGNKTIRCEHHHGVSRHRYRYAPPLTPEGFWNIGFESEI